MLLFNVLYGDLNKMTTFILSHLIVIIVFGSIYYYLGEGHFNGPPKGKLDFGNALHFSMVTQTTVGYGHYTPKSGVAKIIVTAQLLILLGILTLHMKI